MMAIRLTRLKGCTVAGAQDLLAGVGHEGQLALHYPNELILMAVPVALTGPTAGRDHGQIDAKELQALGAAHSLASLAVAGLIERWRIARRAIDHDCGEINLLH